MGLASWDPSLYLPCPQPKLSTWYSPRLLNPGGQPPLCSARDYFVSNHMALSHFSAMVAHACNPSIQEVEEEAGGS
jgi:hypothetical protein